MMSPLKFAAVSAAVVAVATLAACSNTDSATAPSVSNDLFAAPSTGALINATMRLRCELRIGKSSKISVDGSGLTPQNASWRSGVRSGGVTVTHPLKQAIADQVEFDYSSDPNDIAAGAQPIPANYIVVNPSGPDVQAAITLPNGTRVVTGAADCTVR
ncbi:MAG: hypothetical protein U0132_14665 [Gemmatimonadaceae bacterium]